MNECKLVVITPFKGVYGKVSINFNGIANAH